MTQPHHEPGSPTDEAGPATSKAQLREEIRARRRARPEAERAEAGTTLARELLTIPEITALLPPTAGTSDDPAATDDRPARVGGAVSRGCVAAYASFGTEPRTAELRAALAERGVAVLLPVIRDDGGLDWAWDLDDLRGGAVSPTIPEPSGPVVTHGLAGLIELGVRVLLAPALAVDVHGNRLGKAGGFYDRLLAGLDDVPPGSRPLVVAVVHDDELLEHVPTEPHDRPVDAILTPHHHLRPH